LALVQSPRGAPTAARGAPSKQPTDGRPPPQTAAEKVAAAEASAAHVVREEILTRLRAAASGEPSTGAVDKAALERAVAEADAAGLAHEANIGRRKLASL